MLLFLGRKRFSQSSGEFINENDAVDKKASTDSNNGPPKLEDHGGAFPQRGSNSRAHSMRNGQHFGVASAEPRWNNLARDFGPEIQPLYGAGRKESVGTGLIGDKRRTYMKNKKKQAFERDEKRKEHDPKRTERTKHTAQRVDSRGTVFPLIFAAVSTGFMMLVSIGAAFAWMWYVLIFILHLAHA